MNRQIAAGGMILGSAILLSGCQVTEERQRETAYTSAISQTETQIDENLIVVGVSQVGAESDWRIAQTNSIKESLTAENGFYMIFDNAQQKQENQIKAIRNFILQEVDYIVLDPIVMSGWDNVLQNAKEAEIPVILVDRDVEVDDDSLYVTSVVTDMVAEGRNAGYWLEDYLEKQGREDEDIQIVMLLGTEGASAQIGRTKGFTEIAAKFRGIAAIEKEHEERYRKLLENVKNGEVFKKGSITIWKCRNCGHIVVGTEAPMICPVCNHPQSYFEVKAENY